MVTRIEHAWIDEARYIPALDMDPTWFTHFIQETFMKRAEESLLNGAASAHGYRDEPRRQAFREGARWAENRAMEASIDGKPYPVPPVIPQSTSDYMDTPHYRVNTFVAFWRVAANGIPQMMLVDHNPSFPLKLDDLEAVVRQAGALTQEVERLGETRKSMDKRMNELARGLEDISHLTAVASPTCAQLCTLIDKIIEPLIGSTQIQLSELEKIKQRHDAATTTTGVAPPTWADVGYLLSIVDK